MSAQTIDRLADSCQAPTPARRRGLIRPLDAAEACRLAEAGEGVRVRRFPLSGYPEQ